MAALLRNLSGSVKRLGARGRRGREPPEAQPQPVGSPDEIHSPRYAGAPAKLESMFRRGAWLGFEEETDSEVTSDSELDLGGDDEYGRATYQSECDRLGVAPSGPITTELGTSSINAASYGLGVRGLEPLLQALKHNVTVTSLDLSNNGLTDSALYSIGDLLGRSQVIQSLDLSGNPFRSPQSPKALAALVPPTTRNLRTIRLRDCKLGDADLVALFKALTAVGGKLDRLDVGNNAMTEKGAAVLARLMREGSLRPIVLVLSGNVIKDKGVAAVALALASNPAVGPEKLDVGNTGMREGGTEALGQMLEKVPGIQRLVVGGNVIPVEGVRRLADGVAVATGLLSLECDDAPIGDAGAELLLGAAKRNLGLARLTMRNCGLSRAVDEEWRALLRQRGGARRGED